MSDPTSSLKQRLGGRSLYLVGMMGSGKTSTGRPLAEQLGYGFVDADAVIEQAAGCSIPEIFERDGEAGFRSLESQVLSAISQRHSLVVATGGGVVVTSFQSCDVPAARHPNELTAISSHVGRNSLLEAAPGRPQPVPGGNDGQR